MSPGRKADTLSAIKFASILLGIVAVACAAVAYVHARDAAVLHECKEVYASKDSMKGIEKGMADTRQDLCDFRRDMASQLALLRKERREDIQMLSAKIDGLAKGD